MFNFMSLAQNFLPPLIQRAAWGTMAKIRGKFFQHDSYAEAGYVKVTGKVTASLLSVWFEQSSLPISPCAVILSVAPEDSGEIFFF